MRVIITGGTGLIGQSLTQALVNDGHEIIILSRNPRQATGTNGNVTFVKWDAQTSDGWLEWADGADAIVNLAGASIAGDGFLPTPWSEERKQLIIDSRVKSGEAIVDAIRKVENKPKVLIQSSAVGYYGIHNDDVEITEDSPAGNDFLADVCKQWEESTDAVEDMGVRRVIVRTGVVLDKDGGALPRMALPFKMFAGGPLGDGKQTLSWIHMDDEIRAIQFLINQTDAQGAYNLTAPNPVTNKVFAGILGRVMGRPSFIPTPKFVFNILFGEVATVVVDGQRALPKRLLEMGFEFDHPTAETALQALYGA